LVELQHLLTPFWKGKTIVARRPILDAAINEAPVRPTQIQWEAKTPQDQDQRRSKEYVTSSL